MPLWIEKMKDEGMSDEQIREVIAGKTQKYIDKWGNKSRVGVLLCNYNNEVAQRNKLTVQAPRFSKTPRHSRNVSLPNISSNTASKAARNKMFAGATSARKAGGSIRKSNAEYDVNDQFLTTNLSFHESK